MILNLEIHVNYTVDYKAVCTAPVKSLALQVHHIFDTCPELEMWFFQQENSKEPENNFFLNKKLRNVKSDLEVLKVKTE